MGCATGPGLVKQKPLESDIRMKADEEEEEYDIIINDPGFSSWLATNGAPPSFYSNEYYRQKNNQYVSFWNERFSAYNGRDPFSFQINYDYSVDYGMEVNYQLFHYFRYMQAEYGVNLPGR